MGKIRNTILTVLCATATAAGADSRPRIRAVTAFIEVDSVHYAQQIEEAQRFLASAKDALNRGGFEVAGGRLTTQPFPLYTKGMKREDALALVRRLWETAQTAGTALNIGPAMVNDDDDPAPVELLADILSEIGVNANVITADDKSIHWRSISESAKLIKRVSERSPKGAGNFNFATMAMMKPYGPYYPGSYHQGKGHAFAIAMEGASVVAEVFGRYREPIEAERHLGEAMANYTRQAEAIAMRVASSTGWTIRESIPPPHPSETTPSQQLLSHSSAGHLVRAAP